MIVRQNRLAIEVDGAPQRSLAIALPSQLLEREGVEKVYLRIQAVGFEQPSTALGGAGPVREVDQAADIGKAWYRCRGLCGDESRLDQLRRERCGSCDKRDVPPR